MTQNNSGSVAQAKGHELEAKRIVEEYRDKIQSLMKLEISQEEQNHDLFILLTELFNTGLATGRSLSAWNNKN